MAADLGLLRQELEGQLTIAKRTGNQALIKQCGSLLARLARLQQVTPPPRVSAPAVGEMSKAECIHALQAISAAHASPVVRDAAAVCIVKLVQQF